jgi:hypothetical protein
MAISVLGSPSFLANDLMASGITLAPVFRLVVVLCEHRSVVATSAKVCEGVDVGQPMAREVAVEQPVLSGVDSPWQVATAKMDALPAWPTTDHDRLTFGVCMLDNQSGIFLVGESYVPGV